MDIFLSVAATYMRNFEIISDYFSAVRILIAAVVLTSITKVIHYYLMVLDSLDLKPIYMALGVASSQQNLH
jgi:hypothetical protein